MDNKEKHSIIESNKSSSISLENRKKLLVTGVLEVISFDDQQINLNTTLGGLNITGENLKVNKLDVQNGDVVITGCIFTIIYCKKMKKKRKLFGFKGE
ncbi:sporulation protein YabP [uncultured Clostridium sp.]|uniref:sporulation protein YabP n=1 Tax=uncultured Clostridium sp. TaxID=59620 RepID=UPI002615E926|nr:sporulation protein YabP [uncultured Clostridium sp.]